MADEEEKDESQEPDDSEEKFFARVKAMQKDALNEWAAELSAEIDEEEEKKPAEKVKVAFEAKKKPAKPKTQEPEEDETEDDEEPDPTPAERSREAGRRGPRRPSGYWERVGHRLLYGPPKRR